jgi:ComF family protein
MELSFALFPAICPLCSAAAGHERNRAGLCSFCMAEIEACRIAAPRCPYCGIELISTEGSCLGCRERGPAVRGAGVFYYRGALRTLIRRYKFEGDGQLARFAAREFSRRIHEERFEGIVVPVPSSRVSRRRNGWGHMERITREMRTLGFAADVGFLRRRSRAQQKYLDIEERKANMHDAFVASPRSRGKNIILIDDVRTTGTTVEAASVALLSAGASRVCWIVFAID